MVGVDINSSFFNPESRKCLSTAGSRRSGKPDTVLELSKQFKASTKRDKSLFKVLQNNCEERNYYFINKFPSRTNGFHRIMSVFLEVSDMILKTQCFFYPDKRMQLLLY